LPANTNKNRSIYSPRCSAKYFCLWKHLEAHICIFMCKCTSIRDNNCICNCFMQMQDYRYALHYFQHLHGALAQDSAIRDATLQNACCCGDRQRVQLPRHASCAHLTLCVISCDTAARYTSPRKIDLSATVAFGNFDRRSLIPMVKLTSHVNCNFSADYISGIF
jgi:hypothetical protein